MGCVAHHGYSAAEIDRCVVVVCSCPRSRRISCYESHNLLRFLAVVFIQLRIQGRRLSSLSKLRSAYCDTSAQPCAFVERDAVHMSSRAKQDGDLLRPFRVDVLFREVGRDHGTVDLPAIVILRFCRRVVWSQHVSPGEAVNAVGAYHAICLALATIFELQAYACITLIYTF
ncbi:hypothetical protein KC320_g2 [Hortaea werneckii]|nr:hypothetical protein KC320_g2 [Hortaea werneckii]